MKSINEFLGFGKKSRYFRLIDALEVKHHDEMNSDTQIAIETLIGAIDYIDDNYQKFASYSDTRNVIRDAINNALVDRQYKPL